MHQEEHIYKNGWPGVLRYFIVGDVHGCYYTLEALLEHWDEQGEILVFVGDLIDRGHFSGLVLEQCYQLVNRRQHAVVLKGNHEAEFVTYWRTRENDHWLRQGGAETLEDMQRKEMDPEQICAWFEHLPLKWETEGLFVSHAGLSETSDPYNEANNDGLLWNRKPLKPIGKLQVHGHTPLKRNKPLFQEKEHAWNIDTGAVYGFGMSALRVEGTGTVLETITVATDKRDISAR